MLRVPYLRAYLNSQYREERHRTSVMDWSPSFLLVASAFSRSSVCYDNRVCQRDRKFTSWCCTLRNNAAFPCSVQVKAESNPLPFTETAIEIRFENQMKVEILSGSAITILVIFQFTLIDWSLSILTEAYLGHDVRRISELLCFANIHTSSFLCPRPCSSILCCTIN